MDKDIKVFVANIYYKEAKDKRANDKDPEIIAWEKSDKFEGNYPLMFTFPGAGDNIKKKKFFAVKDYEKALFFDKGQLVGILSGGIYKLEKKARIKGTQIVWIDSSLIEIPWGIPRSSGIPTKDGYMVGLYGDLKLKISNVKLFYNDIIAGKNDWRVQNLKDWIITLLHTSLRDIFKNYDAKSILLEDRERVIHLITSKMTEEFFRYGLDLETFNIIGVRAPEEMKDLYNQEKLQTRIIDDSKIENLETLIREKDELKERIKNLKRKLKQLQDSLIDDKISQDEYENKKEQILTFINELEKDILKIDAKLNN